MNKSRPKDQAAYRARSNKRQYNRMVTEAERKALDKLLAEMRKGPVQYECLACQQGVPKSKHLCRQNMVRK